MSSYLNNNFTLKKDLQKLITLCKSSYGPSGCLKLISNDDEIEVTSTSLKIINEFQTNEPLLQFAITIVKNYVHSNQEGGLKLMLYISNWLEQSLNDSVSSTPLVYDWIASFVHKLLISDECSFKISFNRDKINNLISFTENIIKSKPTCSLNSSDINHVSILIVKAIINSIPDQLQTRQSLGRISFLTIPGGDPSDSKLFSKLLITINDYFSDEEIFKRFIEIKGERDFYNIAITSESLDESILEGYELKHDISLNSSNSIFNLTEKLLSFINLDNIDILACQKGIHPSFSLILQRRNILVLKRLGADSIEKLRTISCDDTGNRTSPLYYGSLKSIKILELSGKRYWLLDGNSQTSFQTLIIRNLSVEITNETNMIVQKAYEILKRLLLRDNHVVPGAGCAESVLINIIKKEVKQNSKTIVNLIGCSEHQLIEGVETFCKGLLQTVGLMGVPLYNIMTDSIYGHMFLGNSPNCECGMLSHENNLIQQLNTPLLYWENFNKLEKPNLDNVQNKNIVCDWYNQFSSTLNIALETSSLILRTGTCIYEKE